MIEPHPQGMFWPERTEDTEKCLHGHIFDQQGGEGKEVSAPARRIQEGFSEEVA
jgi:hypothetical protein